MRGWRPLMTISQMTRWVAPIHHSQAELTSNARCGKRMNRRMAPTHENQPKMCIMRKAVRLCTWYEAPHGPVGTYDTRTPCSRRSEALATQINLQDTQTHLQTHPQPR